MKHFILISFLFLISNSYSQTIEEASNDQQLNYLFATIHWKSIKQKEFSNSFITILKQSDPKKSYGAEIFEGTGETYTNLWISITNTGEYSKSKLYRICKLINPKIVHMDELVEKKSVEITISYLDEKNKETVEKTFLVDSVF